MCAENLPALKKRSNVFLFYFIAIVLGIISGLYGSEFLQNLSALISDIFIKIFKCISLPIIGFSIIVTLSQYSADDQMKGIWRRTLLYTVSTTIIASSVACALYLIINPSNISTLDLSILPSQNNVSSSTYLGYLINLIPSNIFAPFLEHQVMGMLFISMVVGIAIRYIPDQESRTSIINFFKGTHGIFLVVIGWIVNIIPIALFGFIATAIIQFKSGVNISCLVKVVQACAKVL